jgi:hypothetical protein
MRGDDVLAHRDHGAGLILQHFAALGHDSRVGQAFADDGHDRLEDRGRIDGTRQHCLLDLAGAHAESLDVALGQSGDLDQPVTEHRVGHRALGQ